MEKTKDFIYRENWQKSISHLDRITKIFDCIFEGWIRKQVNALDIDTIFSVLGCKDKNLKITIRYLIDCSNKSKSLLNIRAIKFMLREIDDFCANHNAANPNVVALYVSTKYLEYNQSGDNYLTTLLLRGNILRNELSIENCRSVIKKCFNIDKDNCDIILRYTDSKKINVYDGSNTVIVEVPRLYKYILSYS